MSPFVTQFSHFFDGFHNTCKDSGSDKEYQRSRRILLPSTVVFESPLLRARYDFLVKICDDRRETDASCLVGLLQGPRDSFPYSAIILKVASLLVISDLLEQQIIGSSSCSRCFYLVKNTTISGVCQCLSWGENRKRTEPEKQLPKD